MDEIPESILEPEVRAICQRYRISPEEARIALQKEFAVRPQLARRIIERFQTEDVTRLGEYKNAIKRARKRIYYDLRRYHRDKDTEELLTKQLEEEVHKREDTEKIQMLCNQLLLCHASTRERYNYYQEFYERLFELIGSPRTILDVACGIHPLSFPFAPQGDILEVYAALDKDPSSIRILNAFAPRALPTRLIPIHANIADLEITNSLVDDVETFDIAFMLKLIPVIARQTPKLLQRLSQIPALQILVTASAESMTRRDYIARREDRVLREFVSLTGREVIGTFSIANEFGYLLS